MAKKTVLQIVQDMLNDTDGDFINSINDTEESQQAATILASTFQNMMSNRNWPHTAKTVNLVPSTNNLLPTHMTLDEAIKELISIYYDKRRVTDDTIRMREVFWKEPDEFLRYTFSRNSSADNVLVVDDPSGVKFLILNDKAPEYFTSFDDTTLIFDSYDSEIDSTLQGNKSLARAYVTPNFEMSDTYIPDLPEEAFASLIEEAKSRFSYKVKQAEDVKSEQESNRQSRWLSRKAWRTNGGVRYPDYGRKSTRRRRDPTFRND